MNEKMRKNNRKVYLKFILIILVALLTGFCMGYLSGDIDLSQISYFVEKLEKVALYILPIIYLLINVTVLTVCLVLCNKAKVATKMWNGEDENIEKAEEKLSVAVVVSNINAALNYLLGGISFYLAFFVAESLNTFIVVACASLVLFIWGSVNSVIVQKIVVDLLKKINPEKQGNIFSTKFEQEWLESCDEAQKVATYKCGYKAYRIAVKTSVIVWLITFLGMITFEVGIFPMVCVSTIMITLVSTYSLESIINKRKK